LQQLDEQFERFENQIIALTKQFAAMGGVNRRCHQPNPRFVEEKDEFSVKYEPINPFAEHGVTVGRIDTL
jgi:hypothetical protein